jgi:hypothetical protein
MRIPFVAIIRRILGIIGVGAIVLILANVLPIGFPKRFDQTREGALAKAVTSKALNPDASGVLRLPPNLKSISATGCAYVTVANGRTIIFVPIWTGRRTLWDPFDATSWLEGFLYDPHADGTIWTCTVPSVGTSTTSAVLLSYDAVGNGWYHVRTYD